jgi:energy-coupling factor transporter ATP-binding protein EcfA2
VTAPERLPIVTLVERLASLAELRWALLRWAAPAGPVAPDAAWTAAEAPVDLAPVEARARELLEHTRSYLVPRARDLDAPLVVVLLGPTGSGKSTLLNTVAGAPASRTGVLRPTTRDAVVLAVSSDFDGLRLSGPLSRVSPERLELAEVGARPGVVIIDAPDIDSVERENRALADTLLEVADLCVFVTTATRYADRVPWDVLQRIEQRRLPLVVIVNRLPHGADAQSVIDDVRRLVARTALSSPGEAGLALEVLGVAEGELDPSGSALRRAAVGPLLERIERLASDKLARRALAEQALAGALAGLAPLTHAVADDLEHAAIDADALRRVAATDHAEELRTLMEQLRRGDVLREEVIRQWHSFVGADQITRAFSSGIGRVRGALLSLFRGTPPAPVSAVQEGATDDLTALVVSHAGDAARRTAAHWSTDPLGARLLGTDAGLWSASPGLADATRVALGDWIGVIASDVAATGALKRGVARGVSVGVNAGAVTVMLSVFAHTGGLTGAEVGIAAATAFLNQKLLNAIFGEAAVLEMIERARDRLRTTLEGLLADERGRFDRLVPEGTELRDLAAELRATVDSVPSPLPG